jgi:hypothetical protein
METSSVIVAAQNSATSDVSPHIQKQNSFTLLRRRMTQF